MAVQNLENPFVGTMFGYTIDFLQELGRGGFGTVYKGRDDTQSIVAIKKVSKSDRKKASTEAVKYYFLKNKLLHENILKVRDVKTWMDSMWIVMEFCDLGDLNKFFSNFQHKVDSKTKINIMRQIAKGVAFLNRNKVVHRDIKPGNILVKGESSNIVIKLGDFGLVKFLDPESLTSAMSSNVGTLAFKAPEFWDRTPYGRVRYHSNVDVYATGLTFTAMLQAKPGHSLSPTAEGFLLSSETTMPIGLAALTRNVNNQAQISVVLSDRGNDSITVRRVKCIIEQMTRFSPKSRLNAGEVEKQFNLLFSKMVLTPCFTLDEVSVSSQPCFVNNNLVIFKESRESNVIEFYNNSGVKLEEWQTCSHDSRFQSFMTFDKQGKEYLLKGCTRCRLIRSFGLQSGDTALYERVVPSLMCNGPDNTIFVYDDESKSILQLRYMVWGKFLLAARIQYNHNNVTAMCLSDQSDTLVIVHSETSTIVGLHSANLTLSVSWRHTTGSPLSVSDVFNLSDGRIGVANGNQILVLDPKDGTLMSTLLHNEHQGRILKVAMYSNEDQHNLAILHQDSSQAQITLYKVKLQPLASNSEEHKILLQNFTPIGS